MTYYRVAYRKRETHGELLWVKGTTAWTLDEVKAQRILESLVLSGSYTKVVIEEDRQKDKPLAKGAAA